MADVFEQVVAVDPSGNMLDLGRSLPNRGAGNISWVKADAEDAPLPEAVDVVTFASSIHWMDPGILLPRLARHLNDQNILGFYRKFSGSSRCQLCQMVGRRLAA